LSLEALDPETDSQDIEIIKDVAANVYMGIKKFTINVFTSTHLISLAAASDTIAAALATFILAMTSFPEIQKKAQEELDRVLCGRLPTHADITSLPYFSAVIKEVIRYVPLGIPTFFPIILSGLRCFLSWRPIVPLGEYLLFL
jgi:Cytochrome P450